MRTRPPDTYRAGITTALVAFALLLSLPGTTAPKPPAALQFTPAVKAKQRTLYTNASRRFPAKAKAAPVNVNHMAYIGPEPRQPLVPSRWGWHQSVDPGPDTIHLQFPSVMTERERIATFIHEYAHLIRWDVQTNEQRVRWNAFHAKNKRLMPSDYARKGVIDPKTGKPFPGSPEEEGWACCVEVYYIDYGSLDSKVRAEVKIGLQ